MKNWLKLVKTGAKVVNHRSFLHRQIFKGHAISRVCCLASSMALTLLVILVNYVLLTDDEMP